MRATMTTQKGLAPVKVGVVGPGCFGRLHALTLARIAEANLVALVARRQASLDALAAELPSVPGWTKGSTHYYKQNTYTKHAVRAALVRGRPGSSAGKRSRR
jgi:hypothetical protein